MSALWADSIFCYCTIVADREERVPRSRQPDLSAEFSALERAFWKL